MKHIPQMVVKIVLLLLVWRLWLWVLDTPFSNTMILIIIVGALLLVYPIVWIGRRILDQEPTISRAEWITLFVQYGVGSLFGASIIRAMVTHQDWTGWRLPIPTEVGLALVIITGIATLISVINLALKGLGAPFAIALSQKLAVDWMYAWTRNPMVLAALTLLVSLGIWYQSTLFILWALFLFTPALLVFVKHFEERELEIRFGASYLEYKARTPFLFPRRPGS